MRVKIYKCYYKFSDKYKLADKVLVADMNMTIFAEWLSIRIKSNDELKKLSDILFKKGYVFVGSYRCELVKDCDYKC